MQRIGDNVPRHVAIIPDGNRRWARRQGLDAFAGHDRGLASFETVARQAAERGVKHLALWGISLNNMKRRSANEVAWLMRLFKREFSKLAENKEIHERRTKISALGRWREKFPAETAAAVERAQRATADYDGYYLNFLLAYNGTDEMLRAVQAIVDEAMGKPSKVTPLMIKENLFTRGLPPVDLLIRTAGEPHLSNGFMMWDTAEAQLYFTDKYWPEFGEDEFDRALAEYGRRERRLGR